MQNLQGQHNSQPMCRDYSEHNWFIVSSLVAGGYIKLPVSDSPCNRRVDEAYPT